MERKALIFNVQKYNMYDGPGIRTIVFFKGCPLRCKWCANPEGLERKVQVMFKKNSCVDCGLCVQACPVGIHTISKETGKHEVRRDIDCTGCRYCMDCPFGVDIPGAFKAYNTFAIGGGKDRMRNEIAAFGEGHGPDQCKSCGKCMKLCPQKIQIPDRMKEIAELLEQK